MTMTMIDAKRDLGGAEKLDWLQLLRSENVGPVTFYKLLERFGTATAALDALPELAKRGGARSIKVASRSAAEKEVEEINQAHAHLIASTEPAYPPLLSCLEDAPPLIIVMGRTHLLKKKTVSIVGTRNASITGVRLAQSFAAAFGEAGFLVASGLARGIDTAAHQGALSAGTVAVVAGGADVIYPKENDELYARIAEQGAVLSEMPLGTTPQARHFPRRNRLISGCARGTVVIEATQRSGSLITARFAAEQNREVFALPGSPLDPRAKGTNDLIRQGAHLADSAEEIIQQLNDAYRPHLQETEPFVIKQLINTYPSDVEVRDARQALIKFLNPTPVTVDEIIRRCQMSPAAVSTVLLELELAGRLERHPGGKVSLIGEV